jgi:hypothetical protein
MDVLHGQVLVPSGGLRRTEPHGGDHISILHLVSVLALGAACLRLWGASPAAAERARALRGAGSTQARLAEWVESSSGIVSLLVLLVIVRLVGVPREIVSRSVAGASSAVLLAACGATYLRTWRLHPQALVFGVVNAVALFGYPCPALLALSAWFLFLPRYEDALWAAACCRSHQGDLWLASVAERRGFRSDCLVISGSLLLLATPPYIASMSAGLAYIAAWAALILYVAGRGGLHLANGRGPREHTDGGATARWLARMRLRDRV